MGYKIIPKLLDFDPAVGRALTGGACFLGISVGSPFITGKHVRRTLEWINSSYSNCVILIGDGVQIYNEIMAGKTFPEAAKSCKEKGDFAADKIRTFLGGLTNCDFAIKRWDEFTSKDGFAKHKNNIQFYYKEQPQFRHSVIDCAEKYLIKKKATNTTVAQSGQFALPLSIAYILEEIAVFSQLIEEGFTTVLYPGTFLKVFEDIVNGLFPNIGTLLKEAIYIDLIVKKR